MTERKCLVFSFADIEVREREFSIVRNGEALAVEPKAFRVLLFLLRNPHKLITKDELLDAVWNDTAVSENSLTRSIALLRRLLADDTHEPRYIATVPTVGYRFLCDVKVTEDGAVGASGTEDGPPPEIGQTKETRMPEHQRSADARKKSGVLISAGVSLAIVVALLIGYFAHRASVSAHTRLPGSTNSRMRVTQLTSLPGDYRDPAFSPSGEQIAFIWDSENPNRGDLYVQMIGGQGPLRLTHTKSGFVCCANWSPDGREIAFGRCYDNGGGVFIVPTLGGPERKVTDVACPFGGAGFPQWTADGVSLVLTDQCEPGTRPGIVLFSLQTGERRCLHASPSGDVGDMRPVLSPDQETIAFIRQPTPNLSELYTISISGKNLRQLTFADENPGAFVWSADSKYIAFDSSSGRMLRVPAAGGDFERETVYPYTGVVSRDGRRLARVKGGIESLIVWRIELSRPGGQVVSQKKILTSNGGNNAVQLSPDEQHIVFQSGRSGRDQIWRSNADGSDPNQMTSIKDGFPGTPRWSPDGKWVTFDFHTVRQHSQIYVIDSEGRNLHAITSGDYENSVPSWSRDGMTIYFCSNRTGDWQVWRHEVSTGQETQVTRHGGFAAFESSDGRTLYFSKFEGGGIWSMPVGGGEEQHITDALHRGYWGHFAVVNNGIYFLDSDTEPDPTVMYYNFQTRRVTPVFTLHCPRPWTANLAASRDGLTLFYTQLESRNAIITMAENFQ